MKDLEKKDKEAQIDKKQEFTIPEVKSQEITVQNALSTPACPDDPFDATCGMYGS